MKGHSQLVRRYFLELSHDELRIIVDCLYNSPEDDELSALYRQLDKLVTDGAT